MKTFYLFLSVIAISFISCDKESIAESFSVGLESNFKINYNYQSLDNSMDFTITEINDSRCPSDVVCIWEGKADVKIEVASPVKGSIKLSTYNHLLDTIGNYSFELIDVSPYPVSTKTIKLEDYDVTLKILDLGN
ncbi:MAG TPA: hypothetical protein VLA03_08125 [Draconibacterium sp.]|nr:hypothetical protein [Draconibacterium sp.]